METLQYRDWNFEYDKEATREYYTAHRDECPCAPCRNFHKNIKEMPAEVKTFLENFGVDIDRPIEQMWAIAYKEDNLVEQVAYYCVKGKAFSEEGYEIDIGSVQIVVHLNEIGIPNHKMEEPCFVVSLHNMFFHWIVEDDINESYPDYPVKKGFLQKFILFFRKSRQ